MADENAPTHDAYVKKYYSKKRFVWLHVGKGRRDKNGIFNGMQDRLPTGGRNGYVCFVPIGQ